MTKSFIALASLALATGSVALTAGAVHAQEDAQVAGYSVNTTPAGTLIDDPAAAEILKRLIPTIWANELFQTMGRSQTLAAIQAYEPTILTAAKLAEIQAEFDKLADAG